MSFCLNLGSWGSIFAVPTAVVDKHIKLANVLQIKTLLYVLRHSGENFSIDDIADALSKHPEDISDSLQYWIENQIIKEVNGQFSPNNNESQLALHSVKSNSSREEITPLEDSKNLAHTKKIVRVPSRPQRPDSIFLAKRISESPEIASLMQEAQIILGKPISTSDSSTILMLHDTDGLPADVILMLMQYAVSINKNSMRYIEKLGLKWADEDVDSVKKAEEKIRELDESRKAWKQIVSIMGIDYHSPSANETRFSNRWINEWKFSHDMIREAYERCVDNTGKVTMSYINKILDSWQKKGILTLEATKEDKKVGKSNKQNKEKETSYDIEEYENMSIFD